MRDSRLTPEKFDAVVMVGGATRMPMVRSLVAKLFGRLPLITIDPHTTIALGAAMQAGLVKRHGALRDVVMTDVCPYTLGVATVDDADNPMSRLSVQPVIERNAVVPISRNLLVSTVQDKQKMVAVEVYQGENLRPENNVLLGSIDVPVPSGPRGRESIDIRFTYDVNGALQVEVKVTSTGKTMERIFRNSAGLSEGELRSKFASLQTIKLHPREYQENRALIARAERIYEEQRGEARDEIRNLIGQFEREIGNQHLRDPSACRQWFAEQLSALDISPFGTK